MPVEGICARSVVSGKGLGKGDGGHGFKRSRFATAVTSIATRDRVVGFRRIPSTRRTRSLHPISLGVISVDGKKVSCTQACTRKRKRERKRERDLTVLREGAELVWSGDKCK